MLLFQRYKVKYCDNNCYQYDQKQYSLFLAYAFPPVVKAKSRNGTQQEKNWQEQQMVSRYSCENKHPGFIFWRQRKKGPYKKAKRNSEINKPSVKSDIFIRKHPGQQQNSPNQESNHTALNIHKDGKQYARKTTYITEPASFFHCHKCAPDERGYQHNISWNHINISNSPLKGRICFRRKTIREQPERIMTFILKQNNCKIAQNSKWCQVGCRANRDFPDAQAEENRAITKLCNQAFISAGAKQHHPLAFCIDLLVICSQECGQTDPHKIGCC